MSDTKTVIHIRIRDLRRERALTQEELAEALGISRQSINAMEAGRCLPSLPVALEIASFFAVPIHYLLADEQNAQNPFVIQPISNERKENMANLLPWSPLREMREMLDGMMDETMNMVPSTAMAMPAVNVSQAKDEVHVDLRLPGYKKENITLEVGEDFLTVSGESETEEETEEKQYFRREFIAQNFSRTISLPALVQQEGTVAEMKHGVLHICLKKKVEEKPKTSKIEIKAE